MSLPPPGLSPRSLSLSQTSPPGLSLPQERSTDATPVPALQTFNMQHPEPPLHKFRWIALPGHPRFPTSNYVDFFALSSKLMHFVPVKSAKQFNPPTACMFHESSAFIVTSVGKEIKKYDVCTGTYVGAFPVFSPFDLTALCQVRVYVCVRACVRVCVRACVRVCVSLVCLRACVRVCIHAASLSARPGRGTGHVAVCC